MTDWYNENIEEPIRSTVKLLRDNGFNTTCSCGHEMEIECELMTDGEMQRLHNLLYNNGFRNYSLVTELKVMSGLLCFKNTTVKIF